MPVLIDADILAFKVASAAETPTQFDDDLWVLWADGKQARREIDDAVEGIKFVTGQDEAILCLSGKNNFRYKVSDTYKANRVGKRRPMILPHLREYMLDAYDAVALEGLEGDDLIGILATGEHRDDHLIYSADKDLKTIPGTHWDDGLEIKISEADALRFFYKQVLTGDVTDGYKGCPGVGPVKADKLLDEDCSWETIVAAYEKAGLSEDDAIVQARLAYILHATHYHNGKPVPWTPPEKTQ